MPPLASPELHTQTAGSSIEMAGLIGVEGVNAQGVPYTYWRNPKDGRFTRSPFQHVIDELMIESTQPAEAPTVEPTVLPSDMVVHGTATNNFKVVLPTEVPVSGAPSVENAIAPDDAIYGRGRTSAASGSLAAKRALLLSYGAAGKR